MSKLLDRICIKGLTISHKVVDVQSGNGIYDFGERLNKKELDFRLEMLYGFRAIIGGISMAIEKDLNQRTRVDKKIKRASSYF